MVRLEPVSKPSCTWLKPLLARRSRHSVQALAVKTMYMRLIIFSRGDIRLTLLFLEGCHLSFSSLPFKIELYCVGKSCAWLYFMDRSATRQAFSSLPSGSMPGIPGMGRYMLTVIRPDHLLIDAVELLHAARHLLGLSVTVVGTRQHSFLVHVADNLEAAVHAVDVLELRGDALEPDLSRQMLFRPLMLWLRAPPSDPHIPLSSR